MLDRTCPSHVGPSEEYQQHNSFVNVALTLFVIHFIVLGTQTAAIVIEGDEIGELLASGMQLLWFVIQFQAQLVVLSDVFRAHQFHIHEDRPIAPKGLSMRTLPPVSTTHFTMEAFDRTQLVKAFVVGLLLATLLAGAVFLGKVLGPDRQPTL